MRKQCLSVAKKQTVGASHFSDHNGYKGASLYDHPVNYAELNYGHALGHLRYKYLLYVHRNHKTIAIRKYDIGKGGGTVNGYTRAIDLHDKPARILGIYNDLGVVQYNHYNCWIK